MKIKLESEQTIKVIGYILITVFLLFSIYIIVNGLYLGTFQDSDTFVSYIKGYGVVAPFAFTLFIVTRVLIPIIPTFLGYAGGTAMFGVWYGSLLVYIGTLLGSLLAFYLARKLGSKFVKSIVGVRLYSKCTNWLERKKSFPIALFIAMLLPLMPDDVLCYLSGLTKLSYKRFALIIVVAKPWCILAYCAIFAQLF